MNYYNQSTNDVLNYFSTSKERGRDDGRGKYSLFKPGLKTNLYSIGVFAVGVILLSVVMFVSPMHRFMDIYGAYAIVNLL